MINHTLCCAIYLDFRTGIEVTHTLTPLFDDIHRAAELHARHDNSNLDQRGSDPSDGGRTTPATGYSSLADIYGIPACSAQQRTAAAIELMRGHSTEAHLIATLDRLRKRLAENPTDPANPTPPPNRAPLLRLTDNQRTAICTAYQNGSSTNQLTIRYRLAKGSILRILRAGGVKIRQPRRLTDSEADHAVTRYQGGESLARIATSALWPKQSVLPFDAAVSLAEIPTAARNEPARPNNEYQPPRQPT
ncbi:hypothetical protein [Nocardia sp. NPDC052112]|uniref:hypothetical protein n=1 Tax=Nocardia sp. NPDC052112 TaxID=3155646 RepID=UPI0034460749